MLHTYLQKKDCLSKFPSALLQILLYYVPSQMLYDNHDISQMVRIQEYDHVYT